jgi:hypothetical protein
VVNGWERFRRKSEARRTRRGLGDKQKQVIKSFKQKEKPEELEWEKVAGGCVDVSDLWQG